MTTLATILTVFGVQLILGTAFYAAGSLLVSRLTRRGPRSDRRLILSWVESSRALARALPFAVALGLAGLGIHMTLGLRPGSFTIWASPLAYIVVGAPATASCFLVVHAGLLERRGRVAAARRQVRLGGLLTFAGAFAVLILMWIDLLYRPRFRITIVRDVPDAALFLAAAMLCLGFAAFVALLAGLSGKPRPSGAFAALLYVAGVVATSVSANAVVEHFRSVPASTQAGFVAGRMIHARLFPPTGPQHGQSGRSAQ